ncbi:MAG: ketoacyl-ACP synthase III [Holosporales bacterium]|jgi:3-oxoacyl-[acyl-carrier-protein] synthase-3|nr:ketoacyl-ACP synthase III [Holosporales bacterium]
MLYSILKGAGKYLPQRIVTNAEISRTLDTSDEWIQRRTGIKQRHIAAQDEYTSDLAVRAAQQALQSAGISSDAIDLVLVATVSPDRTFPSTAALVQGKLSISRGMAFDINAVCSGFLYAVTIADALLKQRQATCALVIGAETFSRLLNWSDRTTAPLFGDGAGAIVLKAEDHETPTGVLSSLLCADGRQWELLYTDGGPSLNQKAGVTRMQGREIFRQAVEKMSVSIQDLVAQTKISLKDIAWLIPHQANARIIEAVAERLSFPIERVLITVDRHANTSAASIPLAVVDSLASGRLVPGQYVLYTAIGAGLTWGAVLMRL